MRVLLTSNASYDPPRGGSTRSNLVWLDHLASAGHSCRVVCSGDFDAETTRGGITIRSVHDLSRHVRELSSEIERFEPDWVLVSSEDLAHVLLREAHSCAAGRLVYLAHTPQWFPFGPESWHPDPAATDIVRSARAIVAIGRHMAGYIKEHAWSDAAVIHPPIYGAGPWPHFGSFDTGWVLMINPCVVKGIAIFAALAEQFPDVAFVALEGWGTTSADRALLARLPNVRLLSSVPNIDDVLSKSRLLLMPSVWYEGFGLIAMEAMLRGLPVIASDSGGLKEAKDGTGYVVPVRPVERYQSAFDERHMPRAVVPPQNIAPWEAALRRLLSDEAEYLRESECSRASAHRFVSRLNAADFERLLQSLTPAASPAPARHKELDDSRRALLLKKLRARIPH
ncbi:MAG: glycosyltransferase family 4 protein [Bryobacteraceae bacterium]|nr:glycosyltransferase family 4 protein [Bryobacteraceae bacterium]